jgi:hypothetical protein
MSTKDLRFKGECPICHDTLPGSDDAPMVFESLKEQVDEIDRGVADYDEPNCTLCGEDCPLGEARQILAKGQATVHYDPDAEVDD